MFAKLTTAFTAFTALAILAVATPAPNSTPTAPAGGSSGSCSTGALQCCQSVESANSAAVAPILAALGVVLQDLSIPVGLSCSGITGVGVGGTYDAAPLTLSGRAQADSSPWAVSPPLSERETPSEQLSQPGKPGEGETTRRSKTR